MKNIPFSINSWIFGKHPVDEIAYRVKKAGADGMDINGEPDQVKSCEVRKALSDNGLSAFCVNGNYLEEERTLCHYDKHIREKAVDYVKRIIELAAETGAPYVVVVPNRILQTEYLKSKEEDWNYAAMSLRELGEYAQKQKITILLEAVNKYEAVLARSLKDAKCMALDTGCPNIRLVADTFHMLTEEADGMHNAIREAGHDWVKHLHVGDNTREVPGMGCINWREVMYSL